MQHASKRAENPPGVDTLVQRWQTTGDHAARDQLVRRYLSLLHSMAYRLARRFNSDVDDAFPLAAEGFLRALDTYDASKGSTLASYGTTWAWARVRRNTLGQMQAVVVRPSAFQRAEKVRSARRHLEKAGVPVTVAALSERTSLSCDAVEAGLAALNTYC